MKIPTMTSLPGGLGPSAGTGVNGSGPTTSLAKPLDGSEFQTSKPAAAGGGDLAHVTLPTIAKSVDGLSSIERQESGGILTASKLLSQNAQAGKPAAEMATDAANLFQRLQGKTLIPSDAHETVSNLTKARDTLLTSPNYAQALEIPHDQSVAEGKIHQSIGVVTTALRMPPT